MGLVFTCVARRKLATTIGISRAHPCQLVVAHERKPLVYVRPARVTSSAMAVLYSARLVQSPGRFTCASHPATRRKIASFDFCFRRRHGWHEKSAAARLAGCIIARFRTIPGWLADKQIAIIIVDISTLVAPAARVRPNWRRKTFVLTLSRGLKEEVEV